MTDLASLVVKLEAETSQYTAAVKQASQDISDFGDKVGDALNKIRDQFLSFEAAKKVFEFGDQLLESMAHLNEMSQALGLTTESLSKLQYAAKLEGINDIEVPLQRLAKSAASAAQGNTKLQDTFASLGVSANDLNRLTTDQLFAKIADGASKYADGLQKTAAIQQIFGRGSANMVALLNQGSQGLTEASAEADLFGITVSKASAEAAHAVEQDMTRIEAFLTGTFKKALVEVLPALDELTKSLTGFAKDAASTNEGVEQIVTGFKLIASAAVVLYETLEILGKGIGGIIGIEVALQKVTYDLETAIVHPKESLKDMGEQFRAVGVIAKESFGDISSQFASAASAIDKIWSTLPKKPPEVPKPQKPAFELPDEKGIKATETTIASLVRLQEQLEQQITTYGMGTAAATAYSLSQGKLADTLAKLGNESQKNQAAALGRLKDQLAPEQFEKLQEAFEKTHNLAEAFKETILNDAVALEQLKNVDALTKLDEQTLKLTGHLQLAADATDNLKNRPLTASLQTAQDRGLLANTDASQRFAVAQKEVNDLQAKAQEITAALAEQISKVTAADKAAGDSELKVNADIIAAREQALQQLDSILIKMQAMAAASGDKSLQTQALALRDAINGIQVGAAQQIIDTFNKATDATKQLVKVQTDAKTAILDVSAAEARVQAAVSAGTMTTLEGMQAEDDLRRQQITLLEEQYDKTKKIADETQDPKNIEAYKQIGIQITQLNSQLDQMGKTVRDDLVNDAASAFTAFATGAESGKKALLQFVNSVNSQFISMAAKDSFQKLFDPGGAAGGAAPLLSRIFGGGSNAATGATGAAASAASNASAGTAIGTAITTSSSAAATALGTAVTTATSAGATELGTAIETSGSAAATEMGTAITTAGSAAAAEIAAAMAGGGGGGALAALGGAAGSSGGFGGLGAAAAAEGGPVYGGQTVYVGETGPELLVSDSEGSTALSTTMNGTQVPQDLSGTQFIGVGGPEYIKPTTSGYIIPTDVLAPQMAARQQIIAEGPSTVAPPASVPGTVDTAAAPVYPDTPENVTKISGKEVQIGLTETFTTDSQGRVSINENVNAYPGMRLPTGTRTTTGDTTIKARDITYPAALSPDQFAGLYSTDLLSQKDTGATFASYFAQYSQVAPTGMPGTEATPTPPTPIISGGAVVPFESAAPVVGGTYFQPSVPAYPSSVEPSVPAVSEPAFPSSSDLAISIPQQQNVKAATPPTDTLTAEITPAARRVYADLNSNNFADAWSTALSTSTLYGTNYDSQTKDPLLLALESSSGLKQFDPSKKWTSSEVSSFYTALGDNPVYSGVATEGLGGGTESLGKNPYSLWGSGAAIASGHDAAVNLQTAGDNSAPDVERFAGARPSPSFLSKYGADIAALVATVVTAGAGAPALFAALAGSAAADVVNATEGKLTLGGALEGAATAVLGAEVSPAIGDVLGSAAGAGSTLVSDVGTELSKEAIGQTVNQVGTSLGSNQVASAPKPEVAGISSLSQTVRQENIPGTVRPLAESSSPSIGGTAFTSAVAPTANEPFTTAAAEPRAAVGGIGEEGLFRFQHYAQPTATLTGIYTPAQVAAAKDDPNYAAELQSYASRVAYYAAEYATAGKYGGAGSYLPAAAYSAVGSPAPLGTQNIFTSTGGGSPEFIGQELAIATGAVSSPGMSSIPETPSLTKIAGTEPSATTVGLVSNETVSNVTNIQQTLPAAVNAAATVPSASTATVEPVSTAAIAPTISAEKTEPTAFVVSEPFSTGPVAPPASAATVEPVSTAAIAPTISAEKTEPPASVAASEPFSTGYTAPPVSVATTEPASTTLIAPASNVTTIAPVSTETSSVTNIAQLLSAATIEPEAIEPPASAATVEPVSTAAIAPTVSAAKIEAAAPVVSEPFSTGSIAPPAATVEPVSTAAIAPSVAKTELVTGSLDELNGESLRADASVGQPPSYLPISKRSAKLIEQGLPEATAAATIAPISEAAPSIAKRIEQRLPETAVAPASEPIGGTLYVEPAGTKDHVAAIAPVSAVESVGKSIEQHLPEATVAATGVSATSGPYLHQELARATGSQYSLAISVQPELMSPKEYEGLLTDRYLKKRESGGPVDAGVPYLVGETGPELMVPDASGSIVPSNKLTNWGGSSAGHTVNNYNTFLVEQKNGNVSRQSQMQVAAQISRLTGAGNRNT